RRATPERSFIERDADQAVGFGHVPSPAGAESARSRSAPQFSLIVTERPWACKPSASASSTAAPASTRKAPASHFSSEVRFMKSGTPSPEEKRAERAVGRTWLEPPT